MLTRFNFSSTSSPQEHFLSIPKSTIQVFLMDEDQILQYSLNGEEQPPIVAKATSSENPFFTHLGFHKS